jgi:hypothetical protein
MHSAPNGKTQSKLTTAEFLAVFHLIFNEFFLHRKRNLSNVSYGETRASIWKTFVYLENWQKNIKTDEKEKN